MTLFNKKISTENPFLLFAPLLILYIGIVLIFSKNIFQGDEYRYVMFAKNLSQGFYSPPKPNINLWNGPGYPIILIPFIILKLPLIFARLFNTLLLYFSVILLFKTFRLYLEPKKTIFCSFLFGAYYPLFKTLPFILTEPLTIFLITTFIYSICLLFKTKHKEIKKILFSAFLLTYIAMTKIIFGYIILIGIFMFSLLALMANSNKIKLSLIIYALGFLFCIPYLAYTYSLTGKFFYWGNSGGESLYWMSSPYKNEFGDWMGHYPKRGPISIKNHKKFFDKISKLSSIERDKALKKEAIKNIINHPHKFFLNWLANIGRMLFSYPFSYAPQYLNTYFTVFPNMFIVVFSLLFIGPTIKKLKKIPFEIVFLLLVGIIYFFVSSLVSAYSRQFFVIFPIIMFWLAFMFDNCIRINIAKKTEIHEFENTKSA